jgi:hypothetical protein
MLVVRSLAGSDLCQELKSSMMFASFQARPRITSAYYQAKPGDSELLRVSLYDCLSVCRLCLLLEQGGSSLRDYGECLVKLHVRFVSFYSGIGQSDKCEDME